MQNTSLKMVLGNWANNRLSKILFKINGLVKFLGSSLFQKKSLNWVFKHLKFLLLFQCWWWCTAMVTICVQTSIFDCKFSVFVIDFFKYCFINKPGNTENPTKRFEMLNFCCIFWNSIYRQEYHALLQNFVDCVWSQVKVKGIIASDISFSTYRAIQPTTSAG